MDPSVIFQMCTACEGEGRVLTQVGPGEFNSGNFAQVNCEECFGEGETIPVSDRCPKCLGKKTFEEKHSIELNIAKGASDGEICVFEGFGNESPDSEAPGDLICSLREVQHSRFKRRRNNLLFYKEITLVESLCGFEFTIEHLDGRVLIVASEEGELIKPGDLRRIDNEGMPIMGEEDSRGDLFVLFDVIFPEKGTLLEESIKALKSILPQPEAQDIPKEGENVIKVAISEVNADLYEYDSEADDCCGEDGCGCGDGDHSHSDDEHDHGHHHQEREGGQQQCAQS